MDHRHHLTLVYEGQKRKISNVLKTLSISFFIVAFFLTTTPNVQFSNHSVLIQRRKTNLLASGLLPGRDSNQEPSGSHPFLSERVTGIFFSFSKLDCCLHPRKLEVLEELPLSVLLQRCSLSHTLMCWSVGVWWKIGTRHPNQGSACVTSVCPCK